jgi:hypothetical protein
MTLGIAAIAIKIMALAACCIRRGEVEREANSGWWQFIR